MNEEAEVEENGNAFICPTCGITFTFKKNLNRHLRTFHELEIVKSGQVSCCICEFKCRKLYHLHTHFTKDHSDINLSFGRKTFYCRSDFEEWKRKFEDETKSRFIKNGPTHKLVDGRVVETFLCHRSGYTVFKTDRKRAKYRKSIKIGKTCPAFIKVYEQCVNEAQEIDVEYQFVHVGHEMDKKVKNLEKRWQSLSIEEKKSALVAELTSLVMECENDETLAILHDITKVVREKLRPGPKTVMGSQSVSRKELKPSKNAQSQSKKNTISKLKKHNLDHVCNISVLKNCKISYCEI